MGIRHQALPPKGRVRLPQRQDPPQPRDGPSKASHISKIVLYTVYVGGAEGIRTPDLINAIDALSQLSYSPTVMGIGLRLYASR